MPWRIVRALGVFALVATAWFYTLPQPFFREHIWDPFTGWVAVTTGWIFGLFGATVLSAGTALTVNDTTLYIDFGCNGLEAHGIFLAAMIASGLTWKRKLSGIVLGLIGVFIINEVRVCGLFVTAWIDPELFQYAHTIVGQTFVIIATMALFLWWDQRDVKGSNSAVPSVPV